MYTFARRTALHWTALTPHERCSRRGKMLLQDLLRSHVGGVFTSFRQRCMTAHRNQWLGAGGEV
jgi:hypothetical protein